MPVSSSKSSMITIPSATVASVSIPQAAAADQALPSIVIPAYSGKLIAAYLRYEVPFFEQATGASSVDGNQYIQIDNSDGSGYHNAILVATGSCGTGGATFYSMPLWINGATDIKDYCGAGKTLAIKWAMAKQTVGIQKHWNVHLYLDLIIG